MKRILILLALPACAVFAQTPVVTGFFNNYGGNIPIAQGSIIAITGSNLSTVSTGLQNAPLATTLQGTRIRFTVGATVTYAPIYYVTPGQVAGIVPSATPTGAGSIIIERPGGTSSASYPITIVRSSFGTLYTAGTSNARVHDSAYRELSSTNSTNPGQYIVFYGSGVGPTTKDETVLQNGANASGDLTTIPITVTIGGKAANVLYRGRTEFPGLDQINVQVPTLDTYSCSVSVVITTNAVQGNSTTIPVAASGSTCTTSSSGGNGGNGGNSSNSWLTDEEIATFTARGSFVTGTMNLNRRTSYEIDAATGAATTKKEDSVGGSVTRIGGPTDVFGRYLRNEYPESLRALLPTLGSCGVLQVNQITDPFPGITYQNLDAGPQWTSVGPNGTQTVPRTTQQVAGPTYNTPASFPNTYIASGRYTLSGPGGNPIGAFSGQVDVATEFVVTNNPDELKTITRSNSVTIRWTGGDPSTYLTIVGQSINPVAETGAQFTCVVSVGPGSFTIPASILQQLPASASVPFLGLLRGSLAVTSGGKGTRITPPTGADVFTLNNSWVWQYATLWQ